jgi:hypothetical protein
MSTDQDSFQAQSTCSDDDDIQSKLYPKSYSIDADADESDNGNNKPSFKSRRFQKTRQASNSSVTKNERRQSSSNDEENKELNTIPIGRTKPVVFKKFDRSRTTTTTDDEAAKQLDRYHPLDNLQSKILPPTTTNESNVSSPTPAVIPSTNQPPFRKVNRFQVKSIRKSQQQQILLANATAAKSSNDDDCSVPNEKSNLQLKPSIIERKHTNTPTTDGENSTINTDVIVNGTVSTSHPVENGYHRVRFHFTPHDKKESAAEEEKSHNHIPTTVSLPVPVPPSSTASAHEEVSHHSEKIFEINSIVYLG